MFKNYLGKKIYKNIDINKSFENARIDNYRFENCQFIKTKFIDVIEKSSNFCDCTFIDCDFTNSIIGYNNSRFTNCSFINPTFKNTNFICPEFIGCKFKCDLKNIDFNASYFENVIFIGELKNIWFKGGFSSRQQEKDFGPSRKNSMLNVDFSQAVLNDLVFSDDCKLDTVVLPPDNKYIYIKRWREFLRELKIAAKGISDNFVKTELEVFSVSRGFHAEKQSEYIINIEDIQDEFKVDVSNVIINLLRSFKVTAR